jgi:hypothetical protein
MNTWKDCGVLYEGCTCPTGYVLSQDVSHLKQTNKNIQINILF